MHYIKANGSRLLIQHQRDYADIHRKRHICIYVCRDPDTRETVRRWAVYYLYGVQSRIRCTLHCTIREAWRYAGSVTERNKTAWRYPL